MRGMLTVVERIDHQMLRLLGFKRHWIETSVGRMHAYELRGPADLPPIVVVHGINTRPSTYRPSLELMRHRVGRLIIPDLPLLAEREEP